MSIGKIKIIIQVLLGP